MTMTANTKRYYSITELAALIGYSRQGIYKAIREGRLKAERVGTLRLVPAAEARRWKELEQKKRMEKHGLSKEDAEWLLQYLKRRKWWEEVYKIQKRS